VRSIYGDEYTDCANGVVLDVIMPILHEQLMDKMKPIYTNPNWYLNGVIHNATQWIINQIQTHKPTNQNSSQILNESNRHVTNTNGNGTEYGDVSNSASGSDSSGYEKMDENTNTVGDCNTSVTRGSNKTDVDIDTVMVNTQLSDKTRTQESVCMIDTVDELFTTVFTYIKESLDINILKRFKHGIVDDITFYVMLHTLSNTEIKKDSIVYFTQKYLTSMDYIIVKLWTDMGDVFDDKITQKRVDDVIELFGTALKSFQCLCDMRTTNEEDIIETYQTQSDVMDESIRVFSTRLKTLQTANGESNLHILQQFFSHNLLNPNGMIPNRIPTLNRTQISGQLSNSNLNSDSGPNQNSNSDPNSNSNSNHFQIFFDLLQR
jgi:hypothetical protein